MSCFVEVLQKSLCLAIEFFTQVRPSHQHRISGLFDVPLMLPFLLPIQQATQLPTNPSVSPAISSLNSALLRQWDFTHDSMLLFVALPAAGPHVLHSAIRPWMPVAKMVNLKPELAWALEALAPMNAVGFSAQGSPMVGF